MSTVAGLGQYIVGSVTSIAAQAARVSAGIFGQEGMYAKNDPQVMLLIEPIDSNTLIEAPIFNAALLTPPTVITTSAASATGFTSAGTTSACDFTPVAGNCGMYCRSGSNQGIFRTTIDTSTTAPQTEVAFPAAGGVAIGDTFVRVPLKHGKSDIYIGGSDYVGMYINCAQSPASNTFQVIVRHLALEEAGKERAIFKFTSDHFANARA